MWRGKHEKCVLGAYTSRETRACKRDDACSLTLRPSLQPPSHLLRAFLGYQSQKGFCFYRKPTMPPRILEKLRERLKGKGDKNLTRIRRRRALADFAWKAHPTIK